MFILLTIALIILLLVTTVWLNIECNHLKYKNKFLMRSLNQIDDARINYHRHKNINDNYELFYRRKLLSILDDNLITLFHH
jgi:hypothetical protein